MPRRPSLVGRDAELTRLSGLLTGDTERAVVVVGEPGVGKTALIEQFSKQAGTEGWQVVRVLGVAAEEPFALGGLHQLVFGLQEFTPGLAEQDRVVLAPVFGGEPDSATSVLPLVATVLNLLAGAARTTPVLLVVDDVHWLDGISAEVISAVGRRLADPRVRILASQRVPHASVFSPRGWSEVPLAPLDAEAAERLLECAGVALAADTRAAVLAAAAGNPLALTELPRIADRIEVIGGAIPLTERLVAVFGGRLDLLDADVRAELLRAALDGIAASAQTAKRSRFVLHNVGPAIEAGLLVVDPLGDFVFRHPLVPTAIVHQAGPQERRDAHRDLAGLYDDVLVRRASHLAQATTDPDQDVADLLVQAATLSIRRGGLAVAVDWLSRAAELCTDPDRRTALFADAVFFAARGGRLEEAQGLLDYTETGREQSASAVLADAYLAFHADGEVISTHRRVLAALDTAGTLDDETLNRLVNLLLSITNYAGDARRREQTNDALRPLEARIDPVILMYRMGVDDIVDTVVHTRSLLSEYATQLPTLDPRRVLQLAFLAYCIDAMADFRAPLQLAHKHVSEYGASIEAMAMGCVVMFDLMAGGHWEQAELVGASGLEMAEQAQGGELLRHHFLGYLGVLAAWRGDLDAARGYAAEVTAWSRPRGLGLYLTVAKRISVRIALAEADYETAYQAAIKISPAGHFPSPNVQVGDDVLDLVEAAVHTGRLTEARAHVAEAVRLNLAEVSPRVAALTLAISAMTAPDSEADELYQAALAHPGLVEFPFEHHRIVLAQGMWLRRRLRHTQARAALQLAADGFDRLGARPWADRARAELRAAGAQRRRSPGEPAQLSVQERRVADHAATGQTTKEIAATLNLSPRTVESHLKSAFRKLGITRRAGLSTALADDDQRSAQCQ